MPISHSGALGGPTGALGRAHDDKGHTGRRGTGLAGTARQPAQHRRDGALRHRVGQGLRRVGGDAPAAGQAVRAGSRPCPAALGHRLVRGPDALRLRRRAGARHRRPDGPLGRDFDNWAICDTVCFHLFDRTPHAWRKVDQWSGRRDEFVKRAAFALVASIGAHDKQAPDAPFRRALRLDRTRGPRRAELRQEGSELGAPGHGPEESGALSPRRWRWPRGWPSRRSRPRAGSGRTRSGTGPR